jgi:antirestriction protein ArdC
MTNDKRPNVYEQITERIVAMLEKGTVPWRKPWKVQTGLPRNLISKKPYRGINAFLLHAMHYESPYWLTFRQALELGGNVRKGEKACPVVFWKQLEVEDRESGEKEKVPLARFYYVFNVAQCDGLKNLPAPEVSTVITPSDRPEQIIAGTVPIMFPPLIMSGCPTAHGSPTRPDITARCFTS